MIELKKNIRGKKEVTLYELEKKYSTIHKVSLEILDRDRIDHYFITETQAKIFYDLLIIANIQIL